MDEKILRAVYDKYSHRGNLTAQGFFELLKKIEHIKIEHPLPNSPLEVHELSKNKIDPVFAYLDTDGDGNISYKEFKTWWIDPHKYELLSGTKNLRIQKAYELYIQSAERNFETLQIKLSKKGLLEILNSLKIEYDNDQESFDALDLNHDGNISFKEFVTWLKWF